MTCLFSPGGITKVFYPDHHPKLLGLMFSATVTNRLSFLLLDFLSPMVSSVPVVFSAQVLLSESKSSRDRISKKQPRSPVSCPSGKPPKTKPPRVPHHPYSSYLVVDTTLPSHVFSDHSLFTTYVPLHCLHHTVFGTDIVVEGIGDVEVRIIVNGKSILFRLRDSWHVPSSSHHFLSASRAISLGNQIMIAGRSSQLIFSHNKRLVQPDLPKYMPFTRLNNFIILKFDIPAQVFLPPQPALPTPRSSVDSTVLSLHASTCHPFAGLTFTRLKRPLPVREPENFSQTLLLLSLTQLQP